MKQERQLVVELDSLREKCDITDSNYKSQKVYILFCDLELVIHADCLAENIGERSQDLAHSAG